MLTRLKITEACKQCILLSETQYIAIVGAHGSGKSTLIQSLFEEGFLKHEITLSLKDTFPESIPDGITTLIIDDDRTIDEEKSKIEAIGFDGKVIFTILEPIYDDDTTLYEVPTVSFREYCEERGTRIDMSEVMSGTAPIETLNLLKDEYLSLGWLPEHIDQRETREVSFESKRKEMEWAIFPKEKQDFLEFERTLAMQTGKLFKADQIAKMLGISRRKVNKYMEILLSHGVIEAIGPWTQNEARETVRHVKLYYTDLAYPAMLLGALHAEGILREGMIENFLYLELKRKLSSTHSLHFYRKKSGAELPFIAESYETGKLTVFDLSMRPSEALSQALQTFDKDYHDRVERYMIFNERISSRKDLNGVACFILPHIAI